MYNFSIISIIALLCYLFLFVAFLSAYRNKINNSFLLVLAVFIFWTAGSLFMRLELWPGINFWFHFSIVGLIFIPFTFFNFVHAMIGSSKYKLWIFWLLLAIINNIINVTTELYIAGPMAVRLANGTAAFVYDINWPIILLFIMSAGPIVHMLFLISTTYKKQTEERNQFLPIFIGVGILFICHLALLLPELRGFPIDVLSGIINALCMFYTLYKKRLFKLTLLISRAAIYTTTTVLAAFLLANSINPMEAYIAANIPQFRHNSILILAVLFTLFTFMLSSILKAFIDRVFTKEEMIRSENLKKFSSAVTKSLQIEEIVDKIILVIQETMDVERIFVYLEDSQGANYDIVRIPGVSEQMNFSLKKENPIIQWMIEYNKCIQLSDIRWTALYLNMKEEEKKQLRQLDIQCMVPLMDEQKLIPWIM